MGTVIEFAILGLGTGAILALLALGLVVIFRGAGVVNLAQGSFAMLGAYLCWQFEAHGWTPVLAISCAVVAVAFTGFLTDQVLLRRLRTASPLARLIATAGMLLLIQSAVAIVWGVVPKTANNILPSSAIHFNGVALPSDRLWLLLLVTLLMAAVWGVWRFTRLGWIAEAVSESPRLASAQGWSPELVSGATWTLGTGLAALAGIFVAPITQLDTSTMPSLIVPVLAAALAGQFRTFWLVYAGALGIGILQSEVGHYVHIQGATDALPFLIIIAGMWIGGTALPLRGHAADRLPRVGRGIVRWRVVIPAVAAAAVILSLISSVSWQSALAGTCAVGMVLLSFVVVIGYTGQVSMAQLTLAGAGGLVASRLSAYGGVPFVWSALAGMGAAAVIGTVIAIPALRTRGINLTIITLGLALAAQSLVFNDGLAGGINGILLPNITLLGWDISPLTHPQRFTVTAFIVFVILALLVARLRRTPAGRTLLAVRGNERAAAASGINVMTGKLLGFTIGGAIAGLGGVFLTFTQPVATFASYDPITGLNYLAEAVIGGVGFIFGAVFGAFLAPSSVGSIIQLHVQSIDSYIPLIGSALLLFTLATNPDGWVFQILKVFVSKLFPFWSRQETTEASGGLDLVDVRGSGAELHVRDVSVVYGGVRAVSNVSLTVSPGKIVGLIGPNGAGKTSLMDAITGFTRAASGRVLINDRDITHDSPYRRARLGVSRSFQNLELYADMTVAEHVQAAADQHSPSGLARSYLRLGGGVPRAVAEILRDFELWEHRDQLPEQLSYGRRRLLGVARAMASGGAVLLIDEPVAGLNDAESDEFATVIRRLAHERGVAVLVIEHDMPFVMGLCDEVVVMDFGKQVAGGTPEQVVNDPAAITAYLGTDDGAGSGQRRDEPSLLLTTDET